ncbi:MAG: ABC transporter permease [Chloroflexi bacterium]|nr:ABC transporter permease [Chloroflexota bacterium]
MVTDDLADARGSIVSDWRAECLSALNGIYALWYRDVLRSTRDRVRVSIVLAQPVLMLLLIGAGLAPTIGRMGGSEHGPDFVRFVLPGIVTLAVCSTALLSATSVTWDRQAGFLKEVLAAPIPRWAIVVGKALGGSTTATLRGLLILAIGPLIGAGLSPLAIATIAPVLFLTAFVMSAIGLLFATWLHTPERFQLIVSLIVGPMFLLSGAFFPLANLPALLAPLALINPVSYGVDGVRQVILSEIGVPANVLADLGVRIFGYHLGPGMDLAIVAGFAVSMTALAAYAFSVHE